MAVSNLIFCWRWLKVGRQVPVINFDTKYFFRSRTLQGHGHWVNVLALNTDYVMRTGAFDPAKATLVHEDSGLYWVANLIWTIGFYRPNWLVASLIKDLYFV